MIMDTITNTKISSDAAATHTKTIHGRYWYFVDNLQESSSNEGELALYVALPVDHVGQQVSNVKIEPAPAEIISNDGNRVLIWHKTGLRDSGRLIFYYDFDLTFYPVSTDVHPDKLLPYDTSSAQYIRNTRPERWIEITPEIRQLASELTGKEATPIGKARNIFDWVSDNIKYEYPDESLRGADKTLRRRKGDCGEFARLFVALCRATGIPARPITALWQEQNGGHVWAEIYLNPYGWMPVDTTIANLFKDDALKNIRGKARSVAGIDTEDPAWFFGNLYPKRIIVGLGANIEVLSPISHEKLSFRVLQPGGIEAYPVAFEIKNLASTPVHCGFYVLGDKSADAAHAGKLADIELAEGYLRAELYDKAEVGFKLALEQTPCSAYAWLNLGRVFMATTRYSQAIEAFGKTLSGQGGSILPVWQAQAHFYLGNCYDLQNRRADALNEYMQAQKSGVEYEGLQNLVKDCIARPYASPRE